MEDTFCTNCGTKLDPEDVFCASCGTKLDDPDATPAPLTEAPVVAVCPTCGDPIEEGEEFCTSCGTQLEAPATAGVTAVATSPPVETAPVARTTPAPAVTEPLVPATPAATDLPEGQFKAEGVWWFRKGDRLMAYENGRWVNAPRVPVLGAPAPSSTGLRFGPLLGAAAVALSAFLAWFTFPGVPDVDTFDFGISALFDLTSESADSGLDVGWVVLAIAAAAATFSMRAPMSLPRRVCGGAAIAVAGLFVYQIMTSLSELGSDAPSLFDMLGIGVFLSLAGGVVLVLDR